MRFICPSVVLLSALSLVGLFPGAARAQEPARMLQGMLGPRFTVFRDKVQDELKLTDEQRSQFMEVVQSCQLKVQPLIKEMQGGGDHQEIGPKMMKLKKDHQVQIAAEEIRMK